MLVEFVVQSDALHQAITQLKANREPYAESDIVDIDMSETYAVLHAIGTESEMTVRGKSLGSVRSPLRIFDELAQTFAAPEPKALTFRCESGSIKVGTFSRAHASIEVSKSPRPRFDIPVDLSLLDTLALAKIVTPREIAEQGMVKRAEDAHYSRRSIVANALDILKPLGIEERQLNYFVDSHIQEAAKRLQKSVHGD